MPLIPLYINIVNAHHIITTTSMTSKILHSHQTRSLNKTKGRLTKQTTRRKQACSEGVVGEPISYFVNLWGCF